LQFLAEKNFKQTIPQLKVEDGEEITYEKATTALRRVIHFFSALQASDGHWPAENNGVLFFLPPLVRLVILSIFFSFFFFFNQCHHCDHHIIKQILFWDIYIKKEKKEKKVYIREP
jgi:hypothetical protein